MATFVSSLERAFPDTPDGSGLLTIGLEEVDVARRHAELAVADTTDLAGMRLHAAHVLHALDPSRAAQGGPGAGFGVVRAAREIAERAEDLVGRDDISENVALHVEYMALAGRGALDRVEQAAELVDRIGRASSAFAALPWARDLVMATKDVLTGKDLDRNGRIEPDRGEAGLSPVRWHLTLLKRGEGTTSP